MKLLLYTLILFLSSITSVIASDKEFSKLEDRCEIEFHAMSGWVTDDLSPALKNREFSEFSQLLDSINSHMTKLKKCAMEIARKSATRGIARDDRYYIAHDHLVVAKVALENNIKDPCTNNCFTLDTAEEWANMAKETMRLGQP